MKNLPAISIKGIVISAVIMIIAGALVVLLPSTSRAHMSSGMGDGTAYIHVPILNNTGETLTIRRMYIDVPDIGNVCKRWKMSAVCSGQCMSSDDEIAVKTIKFDGVTYFTEGSGAASHCRRWGDIADKILDITDYTFSGESVECQIALDVCPADLPSGTYNIRYYFRYTGDSVDRTNTVTFTR
ncbi:MAG: hypothetical protein L6263_05345 [Desulfobacteraceae bacterium]|nr:hypothetical protein [Desulfobacteraceae bacterium]